jgi:hypothetical protein
MSNALAIAHVSQALAVLLASNLRPEFDEAVKMELGKPPAEPPSDPTISVFCYQVTPNVSQRNHDLPARAFDGTLLKRPAAALDLHYLISAYGEESELVGQRLIGAVVRTLHEIPVLPKDVIEQAGEKPYLMRSDLAEAAQRVRFTPTVMDIDETSKLWGMLHQTPYVLSVVYQATLVLIDGHETPVPAKPVERHTTRVLPLGAPGAPEAHTASVQPAPGSVPEPAPSGTSEERPAREAAAKAPTKRSAKATAKAPARARKAAQPRKRAQGAKPARGATRSTGVAPSADGSSPDSSSGSATTGGPEGAES